MTDYYANDDLLANKLGISDIKKFKIVEQSIVSEKIADLIIEEMPKEFNFEYLLHIHRILFEDIYDFAGNIRTVDITKPNSSTPFAYARFIESEALRIFSNLRSKKFFVGLDRYHFISEITELSAELNALHPFRDGNGRTIRLFLTKLAEFAGYIIDYSLVSSEELINADKLAFEGNDKLLIEVYSKVVNTI